MVKYAYEDMTGMSAVIMSIAIILLTLLYYVINNRNLPPGPIGIPYLGIWPFLRHQTAHIQLDEMKKKYGDLFSFTVTGQLYIHLGSTAAVREAHVTKSDCFSGRSTSFTVLEHVFDGGLPFLNGEPWKVMRKFFAQSLKELGLTTCKDNSLYDDVNAAVEELRKTQGEPINITQLLTERCTNIMQKLLFNSDGVSREEILEINKTYAELFGMISIKDMMISGSLARKMYLLLSRKYNSTLKHMEDIFYRIVERHESMFDPDNVRDIIDYYINERNERKSKGDPTAKYFTKQCLVSTLHQFVGDGVVGVASFVGPFVYVLAKYPEEQEKVYKELVETVGVDRQPCMEDRTNLPYTNAFMNEVLRIAGAFPLFPSLQCTKETTLRGYRVPKGAVTLMNMYSANKDSDCYENPEEFIPSRYLTSPERQRADLPLVFGVGKRACVGEGFTMMQVFLFLTAIAKTFQVTLPKDVTPTIENFMAMQISVRQRVHQQHDQ